MLGHVQAIRDALTGAGLTSYFVDVPVKPSFPYVLVWSPVWDPSGEPALSGVGDDGLVRFGLTSVAATPDGVLLMWEKIRPLFGGGDPVSLAVPGRRAWVKFVSSEPVQVDRDVTDPISNRHPAFGVGLYDLITTA